MYINIKNGSKKFNSLTTNGKIFSDLSEVVLSDSSNKKKNLIFNSVDFFSSTIFDIFCRDSLELESVKKITISFTV